MKNPWYREPYVWLLILFPATAVFGGIITIYLAVSSNDGLVVDDYYKRGLEINRTLERNKAAARHGLEAIVNFNNAKEHKFVQLYLKAHPDSDYALPNQIKLSFSHHTRAGFDQNIVLNNIGDNIYQGFLPELVLGSWNVQLEADDWRLLKSMRVPMTEALHITPS